MRDTGKITITFAEYKKLLRDEVLLDELTNMAKSEKYFSGSDIRIILGIPEKEEDE